MKKKVLIITYYWPPSGGSGVQRWVKFVKYLPQFEIDPVILTVSNPTYASLDESLENDIPGTTLVYKTKSLEPFGLYSALSGKSKSEVAKPSTQIESSTSLTTKMASWIRANIFIPDARIGWIPTARRKALKLIEEHDIQTIITTGPPHSTHLIGKYLKERKPLKWIADFRDPWTKIFYNQLLPKTQLIRNKDLKLERSVLKSVDEVIVISPSMSDLQKNITARSYHMIPNGFDHEDFKNPKSKHIKNDTFTIRHIGTLSEAAIPTALFKALEQLPEQFNYRLEFIGNVHEHVRELAQKSKINDRVVFSDYLPHSKAIEMMATSDLLLLVIPDVEHNELILTGKIFEYIAVGKPILMIGPAQGDASHILAQMGQEYFFEHQQVRELKQFLQNIISGNIKLHNRKAIKELKDHPFSRYQLTKKLAQLIKK